MNYTKGKWIPFIGGSYWGIDAIKKSGMISIIIYGYKDSENGIHGENQKEMEANTYLISAAPDLYKALKDALKVAEFEQHAERPWHYKAREAIAKAEGNDV